MQAMSLNFALAQKVNKSFTTSKDQSKRPRNKCAHNISVQTRFRHQNKQFYIRIGMK